MTEQQAFAEYMKHAGNFPRRGTCEKGCNPHDGRLCQEGLRLFLVWRDAERAEWFTTERIQAS